MMNHQLDEWVTSILANPVSKRIAQLSDFRVVESVIDARVSLKNTHGYVQWMEGQDAYESWEATSRGYKARVEHYLKEIDYDMPVYQRFKMTGPVLDIGGGAGTVREFLAPEVKFVSVDPYLRCLKEIPGPKVKAYTCLSRHLNFISANAEFLPFLEGQFEWVHMRSMLDHVQVPDLALLEAHRVLKKTGFLLVGLYVHGGKDGAYITKHRAKDMIKAILSGVGVMRWKDYHTWHPTHSRLIKLIEDNGFQIIDIYWQPHFRDQVCYIQAKKSLARPF